MPLRVRELGYPEPSRTIARLLRNAHKTNFLVQYSSHALSHSMAIAFEQPPIVSRVITHQVSSARVHYYE